MDDDGQRDVFGTGMTPYEVMACDAIVEAQSKTDPPRCANNDSLSGDFVNDGTAPQDTAAGLTADEQAAVDTYTNVATVQHESDFSDVMAEFQALCGSGQVMMHADGGLDFDFNLDQNETRTENTQADDNFVSFLNLEGMPEKMEEINPTRGDKIPVGRLSQLDLDTPNILTNADAHKNVEISQEPVYIVAAKAFVLDRASTDKRRLCDVNTKASERPNELFSVYANVPTTTPSTSELAAWNPGTSASSKRQAARERMRQQLAQASLRNTSPRGRSASQPCSHMESQFLITSRPRMAQMHSQSQPRSFTLGQRASTRPPPVLTTRSSSESMFDFGMPTPAEIPRGSVGMTEDTKQGLSQPQDGAVTPAASQQAMQSFLQASSQASFALSFDQTSQIGGQYYAPSQHKLPTSQSSPALPTTPIAGSQQSQTYSKQTAVPTSRKCKAASPVCVETGASGMMQPIRYGPHPTYRLPTSVSGSQTPRASAKTATPRQQNAQFSSQRQEQARRRAGSQASQTSSQETQANALGQMPHLRNQQVPMSPEYFAKMQQMYASGAASQGNSTAPKIQQRQVQQVQHQITQPQRIQQMQVPRPQQVPQPTTPVQQQPHPNRSQSSAHKPSLTSMGLCWQPHLPPQMQQPTQSQWPSGMSSQYQEQHSRPQTTASFTSPSAQQVGVDFANIDPRLFEAQFMPKSQNFAAPGYVPALHSNSGSFVQQSQVPTAWTNKMPNTRVAEAHMGNISQAGTAKQFGNLNRGVQEASLGGTR